MSRRVRLNSWLVVPLLIASAVPFPAAAQLAFGDDTLNARPLALSISGGISLGSYQAGVNHALLELYRRAVAEPEFRERTKIPTYQVRSITGASAGNVNTLLWAVEACTRIPLGADGRYRSPRPEQSLFWQVWGDMGWERLFTPDAPEMGIFDRNALIDSVAKRHISPRLTNPALVEGCAIPAGITLTRIIPDTINYLDLPIATQRHATLFQLVIEGGDAAGSRQVHFKQERRVTPRDAIFGSVVRISPDHSDIPLDTLLDAVKASASFPFAFAPVELTVHYPRRPNAGREPRWFSDGGVFDNNPVGLSRELYRVTSAPHSGDTLDILYVNPGRYRGAFAEARERDPRPTSPGGIAAVAQLIPGAIVTARQYELQLLARERIQRDREDALLTQVAVLESKVAAFDTVPATRNRGPSEDRRNYRIRERLLLSSRAYPVFSEHLGAFAGFFGRPAREFDMYVGIYDGYQMAAQYHTCARSSDGIALDGASQTVCIKETLPQWIEDTHFLPDPGRQVLAWLYDHEFSTDGALSRRVGAAVPASGALRDSVYLQAVIFRAMGTQFAARDPDAGCVDPRLVHKILCKDGLLEVLNVIAADTGAWRIIEEWSECAEERCRVERVFRDLVGNRMGGSTRVVDEVLERMREVERSMKDDPTRLDDDYVKLVTGLQWVYNASHLRSRPRLDPLPNSVPTTSWAQYVPLTYFGANLGSGGIDARWEPVWNVGNPTYVQGAVGYHYTQSPLASDQRLYGVVGGGIGWYFKKVWLTQMGVAAHRFVPQSAVDSLTNSFTEIEPYMVVLAGQVRLSSRHTLGRGNWGLVHGPHGWTMSVGMADPVGLVYWIRKMW